MSTFASTPYCLYDVPNSFNSNIFEGAHEETSSEDAGVRKRNANRNLQIAVKNKDAILEIKGAGVYDMLRWGNYVPREQWVPATETMYTPALLRQW